MAKLLRVKYRCKLKVLVMVVVVAVVVVVVVMRLVRPIELMVFLVEP